MRAFISGLAHELTSCIFLLVEENLFVYLVFSTSRSCSRFTTNAKMHCVHGIQQ